MTNDQSLKKESFETTLKKLEDIVMELERGNLPLESSLAKYEEGIACLKHCHSVLGSVEKKISLLSKKDDGSVKQQPFNHEQSKTVQNKQ